MVLKQQRGDCWEEGKEVLGEINGDGRRLDLGCEHTTQCPDDVLLNCAPETGIILLTRVTSATSIKRKK